MVSKIDKYVAEKVKQKRIEKGLSQSELANKLDVSHGFIGKIESGKYGKKYSLSQLNDIAIILKCSISDLLPERPFKK